MYLSASGVFLVGAAVGACVTIIVYTLLLLVVVRKAMKDERK